MLNQARKEIVLVYIIVRLYNYTFFSMIIGTKEDIVETHLCFDPGSPDTPLDCCRPFFHFFFCQLNRRHIQTGKQESNDDEVWNVN